MTTPTDSTARLIAEAEAAEAELEGSTDEVFVRSRRQAKDPSQVYSVRIPAQQIAHLRQIADERGVGATVLMRQWVLERLAGEDAAANRPEERLVQLLAEAGHMAELVRARRAAAPSASEPGPAAPSPAVRLGPTRRLVVR